MAIDEKAVVSACNQLPLIGNEDGLIPAFGLYLSRHYADFYNLSSFEAVRQIEAQHPAILHQAEQGLVEAGMLCAFYTFGGIMLSQEWEAVVMPMVETVDDWVAGIVAVVNSFGWGKWVIEGFVPGERLEISIANSYESTGWLSRYENSSRPRCYLVKGGCAGIMNLLYQGDIRQRPNLTPEYFEKCFHSPDSFRCEELTCRTMGDDVCRFVTTRMTSAFDSSAL
ncbi:MAG: hypothetical protein AAF703_04650 [Cyanobacteria bacterium P01_D01_bin.105]